MRRVFVALTLAAALAGPATLLDQVWSLFTSALSASSDAGCGFDPNGRCSPAPQADAGCIFDPDGRCNPAPQTDAGLGFDPNG